MKDSSPPSIGDIVVAVYDIETGISCAGLVMEVQSFDCKVQWLSESNPVGWWQHSKLKVISTA